RAIAVSLARPAYRTIRRLVDRQPTAMLFYGRNPRLRNELLRTGRLKLRAPSARISATPDATIAAERVLSAYRLAVEEGEDQSEWRADGLWEQLIATEYRGLTRSLESGNPAAVAETLEGMFASQATVGLSMSGELPYLETSRGRDFYVDWWLDGLLSIASYLGLLAEGMETGKAAIRSASSFEELYAAVQRRLGTTFDFPDVCNAWGL